MQMDFRKSSANTNPLVEEGNIGDGCCLVYNVFVPKGVPLEQNFSDLNNNGISFDEYKGKLLFGKGMMQFVEPLEIESPSSKFKLSGKALLESDTLDLRLIATLPVSNNATWVAAIAGGLPAAAGVYVASKIFDKQISSLSSLSYRITGPMSDPVMSFERIAPQQEKPAENTPTKPASPTKRDATKSF